ncbi:MAG: ferritin-like domain-containing protein [Desulfotomaculales bacterium]
MWFFRVKEIVNFAAQIERNGQAFYRTLLDCIADDPTREVIAYLAEEEARHEATFSGMLAGLEDYSPAESFPGEYEQYLRWLVDNHVFIREADACALAKRVTSPREALDLALGFEKDSLLFFHELRQLVPEGERGVVDGIIREEREHVRKLAARRKEV